MLLLMSRIMINELFNVSIKRKQKVKSYDLEIY